MTFQWPYVLFALPFALGGLLLLFFSTQRARAQMLGRFAAARLLPVLLVTYSPILRLVKNILVAGGVLFVLVALARPQWGYDWQENHARGVDVVFVLDTSRSMLTPDVQPSRLERAKLAIYDCVQKMPGNRIGLVAFAGDAFLQCPLTLDYDAFRQTLDAVDTNTIARGGTDIAVGLDAAATALEKSGNHKIIVLLTDGEDLEAGGVAEAKTLAEQGITIYTVGVGTAQGEIIPIRDSAGKTGFVRDERGELVKSQLDSTTLSDIANATHGFYQPLGPTGEGLMRVYEDGIKKLPDQDQKSKMTRQPVERYQWPLAAAVLLLTAELLIGTRRPAWRHRNISTVNLTEPPPLVSIKSVSVKKSIPPVKAPKAMVGALLMALALPAMRPARAADAPAPPEATPVPAAQKSSVPESASPKTAQSLFEKGDYSAAAEVYSKAADASPTDGRFRYNQGESLYRSKDYEGAAQAFTKSLSISNLSLQQQAYYNLGNAHYRLGQEQVKEDPQKTIDTWGAAVKDFQNALDLDPKDADARYNLELVKKQIEALKKQQEKQQQQKDQQQNQQNQQDKQDQKDQQDQKNQPNQSQNQQQQNQQNQSNQQDKQDQQQNSSNQQNQDNQQQNNSPQDQKNSSQNQSGQKNPSNSQNSSGQPDQKDPSGKPQGSPDQQPNSPNSQNSQKPGDKSQPQSNSANPQNGGQKQPQNASGQQPKPSSGTGQKQPASPPSQNGQQQKNGQQPQPAKPSGSGTGKEPNGPKSGQQPAGASSGGGQPSTANAGDTNGTATVTLGVMTRDEAMQLLNSLKPSERKLPASRLQSNNPNPSSSDQDHKDW